jgi:hypothetical protein
MARSGRPTQRERTLTVFGAWIGYLCERYDVSLASISRMADIAWGTLSKNQYEGMPQRKTVESTWAAFEQVANQQGEVLPSEWRTAFFHAGGIPTDQDQQASEALLRLLRDKDASEFDLRRVQGNE